MQIIDGSGQVENAGPTASAFGQIVARSKLNGDVIETQRPVIARRSEATICDELVQCEGEGCDEYPRESASRAE
jgi:hypothetical protein